jgi:hypothetical protein
MQGACHTHLMSNRNPSPIPLHAYGRQLLSTHFHYDDQDKSGRSLFSNYLLKPLPVNEKPLSPQILGLRSTYRELAGARAGVLSSIPVDLWESFLSVTWSS